MASDDAVMRLIHAIAADDGAVARRLLDESPELVTAAATHGATRQDPESFWLADIEHYVYKGDTPLHIAAAAYGTTFVDELLRRGATVDARNRRGASPLHYATDGGPTALRW